MFLALVAGLAEEDALRSTLNGTITRKQCGLWSSCNTWCYTSKLKRVFKTRHFGRWVRKAGLSDQALCQAVEEMAGGLIDADLGGGGVKKRVGIAGRGKRGGARTLVATNKGTHQR